MTERFYLAPKFCRQQSFYQKAEVVRDEEGILTLYSYQTPVAVFHPATSWTLLPYAAYSNTTVRHVNEFLLQYRCIEERLTIGQIRKLINEPQNYEAD